MSKHFASALLGFALSAGMLLPVAPTLAATGAVNPGDLIKGSLSTVYYFAPNGKRLVFPNEKTYFTWYKDFSGVKTISNGQLSTIPLGGNVTYRPGRKMVKITTDPKVYVVDRGGFLRHVASEGLAQTLYGILTWKSNIDDIPDAFFVNYHVGTDIQTVSDFNPADVMTLTPNITIDKGFDQAQATVTIGSVSNGFVPASMTVKRGTTVTWVNGDNVAHSVIQGTYCPPSQGACATIAPTWSSEILQPGQSYRHTFNTAGSFDYHCGIHPVMQGTVNVE